MNYATSTPINTPRKSNTIKTDVPDYLLDILSYYSSKSDGSCLVCLPSVPLPRTSHDARAPRRTRESPLPRCLLSHTQDSLSPQRGATPPLPTPPGRPLPLPPSLSHSHTEQETRKEEHQRRAGGGTGVRSPLEREARPPGEGAGIGRQAVSR